MTGLVDWLKRYTVGLFTLEKERAHFSTLTRAPVVLDPFTKKGIKPFVDFVETLRRDSTETVSGREAERIAPYFTAMNLYLKKEIDKLPEETPRKAELETLIKPGNLSGIFNAMAAATKTTLISDVSILPKSIKTGPAGDLFRTPELGSGNYYYKGCYFHFGFTQIGDRKNLSGSSRSVTLPIFLISDNALSNIVAFSPEPMLRGLQSMINYVNHDMLHHMTSPIVNPVFVRRFNNDVNAGAFYRWDKGLNDYEEWAQMSHEQVLLQSDPDAAFNAVTPMLDGYFSELKRIGAAIEAESGQGAASDMIDIFGMIAGHVLTRVFPLDHPVMARWAALLQETDPLAEAEDYLPPLSDDTLRGIISGYKRKGFDLDADERGIISYERKKLVQLAVISPEDVYPHMPYAVGRRLIGEQVLDMIKIAAHETRYKPE